MLVAASGAHEDSVPLCDKAWTTLGNKLWIVPQFVGHVRDTRGDSKRTRQKNSARTAN